MPELILPDAAASYFSADYTPRLYPALPKAELETTCAEEDPAFGRCQMPPSDHGVHRARWDDGFEASWRQLSSVHITGI